jgi:hypothetical protein
MYPQLPGMITREGKAMSMNIQGNTAVGYSTLNAAAMRSEVTLSGEAGSVEAAVSGKHAGSGNIAGKLNSLEHSATANARPMFLKGILQKLTGAKIRDLDIGQMELDRTQLTADVSQIGIQGEEGSAQTYSAEQLQLAERSMNLSVQGTIETKAGSELSFDMQLSSAKVSAAYAALVYQSVAADSQDASPPAVPDTGDTTGQEQLNASA